MSIRLITKAWDTDLKGNELLVLISLADNASDEGYCFPSWNTIMKKTKVSKGTLSKILKTLEEKGHLKREHRSRENGSNKSNAYWIHPIHSSETEPYVQSSKVELGGSSKVELVYEPSQKNHQLKEKDKKEDIAKSIIDYLNLKANKNFKYVVSNIKGIIGRWNDGYSVTDMHHVIDVKCAEWLNDEKMNKHLNPVTLFRPDNFDKYLNQKGTVSLTDKLRAVRQMSEEGII